MFGNSRQFVAIIALGCMAMDNAFEKHPAEKNSSSNGEATYFVNGCYEKITRHQRNFFIPPPYNSSESTF